MQISVLAVKCRFCGEEVGKPKEEQRTLSINDLGGELIQHRAPSGSVMEALEAFRVETGLDEVGGGEDPGAPPIPTEGADGMPVLNDDGFGSSFDAPPSAITSVHEKRPVTFQDRVKTIGLAVGGLLVVVFLVVKAPGWIEEYKESDAEAIEPVYVNRAPGILDRGGPPIEALEAAVAAIDHEDSAQNRRIAEDALDSVLRSVHELLNSKTFSEINLSDASLMTNRASTLYPNQATRDLVSEMRSERLAYRMTLLEVNREAGTATFQPSGRGVKRVTVAVEDTLLGRFYVKSIVGNFVTLQDKKRGGRVVTFETGGGIRK